MLPPPMAVGKRCQIPELFARGYWLSVRNPSQSHAAFGSGCYAWQNENPGQNPMAGRLLFISLSVLLAVSGSASVRAADPAFCRAYAKAALVQVRGALANPDCGASLQGTQWSMDFSTHYEWCLEQSPEAAGVERDARTKYEKTCPRRRAH
jgi:hypothetical protein